MTYIRLGKYEASLLNPPNDGVVDDGTQAWKISRNGSGMITLRANGCTHPQFLDGMDMRQFCEWINSQL
jgi:hypothetical protein